jgi:hypothetical protein
VFETLDDLIVPAGETAGIVSAIEGETKEEILGSSTGLPAQFFELSFRPLSYSPDGECSLEVYVTENAVEERWTLVPSLLDSKPSAKHFEIEIDENNIVTVSFGDNQNGKIDFEQLKKEIEKRQNSAFKLYQFIWQSKELKRIVESMNFGKNSLRNHLLLMVNLAINDWREGKLEINDGTYKKISQSASE